MEVKKNLDLEFYMRYMSLDVESTYLLTVGSKVKGERTFTFPMSHITFGVGARYSF